MNPLQKINSGEKITDLEFDQIFPEFISAVSEAQWSSVEVAFYIASLLSTGSKQKFLDIGSGPGKLCILLSLLTKHEFYGIEQRATLVNLANEMAQQHKIDRVHFRQGDFRSIDWNDYDVLFLYNPFQEHLSQSRAGRVNDEIELHRRFYFEYTESTYWKLVGLSPGKKVITFEGYGGPMPLTMKFLGSKFIRSGTLCLWEKTNAIQLENNEAKAATSLYR